MVPGVQGRMKPKVALSMIVAAHKNDGVALQRCLSTINGYVDGMFIQLNAPKGKKIDPRVKAVAERFADHVYEYEWKNNFVDARNDSFKVVPKEYDWIAWLDEDDVVQYPEMVQKTLAIMPKTANGVYIYYEYKMDGYGNVTDSLWTCRAVRNNGSYVWKSSIDDEEESVHETLVPRRTESGVSNNEWRVTHQADEHHHNGSLVRNIGILQRMYERQAKKPQGVDPRILYYLGTHCYSAFRFREAKDLFYEYLKVSGWYKERSEAHVYMGKLLKMEGNLAGARTAFLMATGEDPDNRNAYLELMRLESKEQRWEQAVKWGDRAVEIRDEINSMTMYNPQYDTYTEYAQALANLGGKHLSKSLKYAVKALELRPYDPGAKQNRETVEKLVEHRDNLRAVGRLLRKLKNDNEDDKTLAFLDNLPSSLADSPVVITARQEYTPGVRWPKKSIAIYVGQGPLGNWGPDNLDNGGLGGSEEAVIRLSTELSDMNLGWKVVVFGTPGTAAGGYFGGTKIDEKYRDDIEDRCIVEWKHYWELNQKDEFDVLISWRQPAFFDLEWTARKKYLWLHDVMPKDELFAERIKNIDKIIYVSKYHSEREENDEVPQKQKFPSGNGITPADFSKLDGRFRRRPHRCIYMSANERGLRLLYDIWPDVRAAVPDAELDVFYGWHSFDAVNRDNPERMAWKASMVARARELPGVTERGRIGQDKLNEEIFKSGIFAYPCTFPEVYAITYVKALAGGAQAITSDFAVLKEYEQYATQIPLGDDIEDFKERYKKALIHALKNPMPENERMKIAKEVRAKYSWANTAKQWSEEMQ